MFQFSFRQDMLKLDAKKKEKKTMAKIWLQQILSSMETNDTHKK